MKKIVSMLIALLVAFSVITVSADVPEALSKMYTNYSCDYKISITFESSDDIIALLEEMEMPEEVDNFVDLKALLKSVLTNETRMNLQADISEDFSKVKIGITSDSSQTIDVNSNLNIGINTKLGMWLNMDFGTEEPVFEIIYSHPFLNKYMIIDLFEMPMDETEKAQIIDAVKSVFNKDFMTSVQGYATELLEKYADIKILGSNCIVKIDNDGLTSMIDDAIEYVSKQMQGIADETMSDEMADEVVALYSEIPSVKGMQFVGEDGITINYSLGFDNITNMEMDADININIANIYTQMTGGEWLYQSEGVLRFKLTEEAKMSKISKTKVDFPELTDDNSFSFVEMMYQEEDYEDYDEYYEYEPIYPNYYVYNTVDYLPVIDGKIYFPLRDTMIDAYEDTVGITYDNGVITMTSDYFPGYSNLELSVGSGNVFTDGNMHTVDPVIKVNNVVYANRTFFEEILGWSLWYANYDMLNFEYTYEFVSSRY